MRVAATAVAVAAACCVWAAATAVANSSASNVSVAARSGVGVSGVGVVVGTGVSGGVNVNVTERAASIVWAALVPMASTIGSLGARPTTSGVVAVGAPASDANRQPTPLSPISNIIAKLA